MLLKGAKSLENISNHSFALCAYKESEFLEECILSLLAQSVKSKIIIATSTPNEHINSLARKYSLEVFVNEGEKGIGGDWNFAYSCCDTPLVTIAHQDDIYEPKYTEEMLGCIKHAKNPIIYFCGYAELRNAEKVFNNSMLKIKRLMLSPLKIKLFQVLFRMIFVLVSASFCTALKYIKTRPSYSDDKYTDIDDIISVCDDFVCSIIHIKSVKSAVFAYKYQNF